jgi:hypothetical protein
VIKSVVFCAHPETKQHLFFECHFTKFIWSAVQITFNIHMLVSMLYLFNVWANSWANIWGSLYWQVLLPYVEYCGLVGMILYLTIFRWKHICWYSIMRRIGSDSRRNYKGVKRRQQWWRIHIEHWRRWSFTSLQISDGDSTIESVCHSFSTFNDL